MLIVLLLILTISQCYDALRPIWNIGHMVNNLKQIDEFLNLGANGVETDIKFSYNGDPLYMSHGIPCDCGRNCLRWDNVNSYFNYVAELTTPESPRYRKDFLLLTLDLKVKHLNRVEQSVALEKLAVQIILHLWKNGTTATDLNILIHLPDTSGIDAVKRFSEYLMLNGMKEKLKKIGWEVWSDESIEYINGMWELLNMTTNNWQGDGITNCLTRSTWRLRSAVANRDRGDSVVKKVYYWTVDKRSSIRDTLRIGVDAIMTNYPNRVVDVLQEPEFKRFARIATGQDSPFEEYKELSSRMARIRVQIPEMIYNRDDADNKTAIF